MKELFKMNGEISQKKSLSIELGGFVLFIIIWWVITEFQLVSKSVIPSPFSILKSIPELHTDMGLIRNLLISLALNFGGYFIAITASLFLGFVVGLIPFFKSLLNRYIDAIRFVPLAAVTGLFIAWFGISLNMKIQFLAFGIFVFLMPIVIQKIKEVDRVYLQTSFTMGATSWQTITNVYWPYVTSRIIDDIRVLTAISWTYIISAELINTSEGGLGVLINKAQRMGRLDMTFALLFIIVIIGFLQDMLFVKLDKQFFKYKYV